MSLEKLVGTTILSFEGLANGSDEIKIHTDKGVLRMKHYQDCCESVSVEDICGYPEDLINRKVEVAESRSNSSNKSYCVVWTFYTIRTHGGDLDIRWCGSSNGYYSVDVSCEWEEKVEEEVVNIPADGAPIFQIISPTEEKKWGERGTRKTTLIRVRGVNFQISEIKGTTFMGPMNETVIFMIKEDGTRSNRQFDSASDTNAALLKMMGLDEKEFKTLLSDCQRP